MQGSSWWEPGAPVGWNSQMAQVGTVPLPVGGVGGSVATLVPLSPHWTKAQDHLPVQNHCSVKTSNPSVGSRVRPQRCPSPNPQKQ